MIKICQKNTTCLLQNHILSSKFIKTIKKLKVDLKFIKTQIYTMKMRYGKTKTHFNITKKGLNYENKI